ncbi:MAG: SET domain-containing protein [Patescibacteria group bacterium]|nr:SET domain-containing protein [Patescibacteria group bacterium]MDE1944310.1 SET domain-containing protein [Patescibacteria group bacterium]MDE1945301.1 SET domain-containing protein [Patescibacteria group bacterium]MDE2057878.1 SET domain-containing protein [Patescibacteria group bacterium]
MARAKVPAPPGTVVKRSSAGLGLFATRAYKKGERVIEYVGRTISKQEEDTSRSLYLFNISDKRTIDGRPADNPAGYINHSCKPNCEVYIYGGRVFIRAAKAIRPGDEFSYDYGEEYYLEHIAPYGCRCGAPKHLYAAKAAKVKKKVKK